MTGGIHPSAFIHPKAHVDETCGINADCKVWQFASVTRGTVLGPGCNVSPFALLDGAILGARCIVSMYAAAGPGFVIGDDVFLGPGVVFANDAWPSTSKAGFDAAALRDGSLVVIRVGDGVSIGANSDLLPGITIGAGSMIAAGSIVDRSIPPMSLFARGKIGGYTTPIDPTRKPRRMKPADHELFLMRGLDRSA